MGNCTVTIKKQGGIAPAGVARVVDIALSSSYATNGDTVTLASLGLDGVDALVLCSSATSPGGHALEVIHGATPGVAPKIRARDAATGAELGNGTNQSAQSVRAIAYSLPNP